MKVFWASKQLGFGRTIRSWEDVQQLHELGITHVINLRGKRCRTKLRSFHELWLPFRDDKKPRPNWFYRDALHFYIKAKRQSNSKTFVMCRHGLRRSPSLVYFLLRVGRFTPARAKAAVLKARPQARIVPAYKRSGEDFRSLYKFRQIIKGKQNKS